MARTLPEHSPDPIISLNELMNQFYTDPDRFARLSRQRCVELSAKGAIELRKRLEYITDIRRQLKRFEAPSDDVEFLNTFTVGMRETRITRSNDLRRIIMTLQKGIKTIVEQFKETRTTVGASLKILLEEQQSAKEQLHNLILWVRRFFEVYQAYLLEEERYIDDLLVAGCAPVGEVTQAMQGAVFSLIEMGPLPGEASSSIPQPVEAHDVELEEIKPPTHESLPQTFKLPKSNWLNLQESFMVTLAEGDQDISYLVRPVRVHEQSSLFNVVDGRRVAAVEVLNQETGEKHTQLILFEREQEIVWETMRERVVDVYRQPDIAKVLDRAFLAMHKRFSPQQFQTVEKIKTPVMNVEWETPMIDARVVLATPPSLEFYYQLQDQLMTDFDRLEIAQYDLPNIEEWIEEGLPISRLIRDLEQKLAELKQLGETLEQEDRNIKTKFNENIASLSEDAPRYASLYRESQNKHRACYQNIQLNHDDQRLCQNRLTELRAVIMAAWEQHCLKTRPVAVAAQPVSGVVAGQEAFQQKKVSYFVTTELGHYLLSCDQVRILDRSDYRLLLLSMLGGRLGSQKLMIIVSPDEQSSFVGVGKAFYDGSLVKEIQLISQANDSSVA